MTPFTTPAISPSLQESAPEADAENAPAPTPEHAPGMPDVRVYSVQRLPAVVAPETRAAVVIEMLKVSPYRAVPVVDSSGRLKGMATEAALSRALIAAPTMEERARIRRQPIADVMEPLEWSATPLMTVAEASALLDRAQRDVLPVLGPDNAFSGLVGRGDLVQELTRPFQPPTVGGMATPLGVYLTTGRVSGGAGTLGLMLTGLMLFSFTTPFSLLLYHLQQSVHLPPLLHDHLPAFVRTGLAGALSILLTQTPALLALRFSSVAGYHAAEHQVVHAIERGEPLLPEVVRDMPRVHPRCGTNFVAAVLIGTTVYAILPPLPMGLQYVAAGLAALLYWRQLGSWLQQHVTTRPATDAQIESGIRAAREILSRQEGVSKPQQPLARLWRMGMLQVFLGFGLGFGLLTLIAWLFPPLGVILKPALHDMLLS